MTYITDTQVEKACETLRKAINAAENSNHAGEEFVVAAANATALVEALEHLIPSNVCTTNRNIGDEITVEIDLSMGDLRAAVAALALAKGGRS